MEAVPSGPHPTGYQRTVISFRCLSRSEAPTPVSRRFTPVPSVECSPPPSSHRTPKAGRRAFSGSGTPKSEIYTPGGSKLQPPRSSARFGNSPALAEFSERRSTGRRSQQPTTRSVLEARVNAEVGDIFKQVSTSCRAPSHWL